MDTNSNEVASPRTPKGRIWKFLLRGTLALFGVIILAALVAHLAWRYSGSSKWEKVGERKGVTVYALKAPGTNMEQFKAVWKIRSKMSKFAMWVSDTKGDTPHSMRRETGLYDHRVIDRPTDRQVTTAWKQPLVSFLEPREFVVKSELSQDPATKTLLYTVNGVPERIPADDCCVRVPVMANKWTLTPLKTGEIQVEWLVNMDIGGAVPYVLQNKVLPGGMLTFAPKVQEFIEQDKYKNAKYDWLQEAQQ
jgi:hypothetical protein